MKVKFREDGTLVICPENSVEAMALRYWHKEYEEHGAKMMDVETSVPMRMPDGSAY